MRKPIKSTIGVTKKHHALGYKPMLYVLLVPHICAKSTKKAPHFYTRCTPGVNQVFYRGAVKYSLGIKKGATLLPALPQILSDSANITKKKHNA